MRGISCTNCRSRKIKCHRQLPTCSFCRDNGLVCSYDQAQKKRGLRAGYVASLEDRLGIQISPSVYAALQALKLMNS